jgi:predicted RNA-binding protein
MCEANAYLYRDGEEELILEDVDIMRPEGGKYYLCSITGEQKLVDARIREISLVSHKIILEKA